MKFIVTADDVIHSFAVPAFWIKQDANPGQLHEAWVKVDRPGVYFGQCSELCGARHGFMPIAVEVVPPAEFATWVASKGGHYARRNPGRCRSFRCFPKRLRNDRAGSSSRGHRNRKYCVFAGHLQRRQPRQQVSTRTLSQ